MTVRTVIVGCGIIAPIHATGVAGTATAIQYTGAFDSDPSRAEALATKFGIPRVYATWDDVLADPAVDAVDLCLPHHLHHPCTLAALNAGKHVLVEKPLATNVVEASEMIVAAQRAGRVLMPVHNRVFVPTLQRMKEIVDAGHLGDVYLIKTLGIEPPETTSVRPWLHERRFGGGGVTLAQTVHFAYLCRWLLGDVRQVGCLHGRHMVAPMEAEDTAIILLQFRSGNIGEMTSTFAQQAGGFDHRVTIYGSQGVATANHRHLQVTSPSLYGDSQPHDEPVTPRDGFSGEFGAVIRDFGQAVETGNPPVVSAIDGLRAVEIIEAATLASAERRFIDVPLRGAFVLLSAQVPGN